MENDLNIATIRWYLKDNELHYRRAVAEYLERLVGNIDIFPADLVRALLDDPDDVVKEKAMEVLAQIPEVLTETDISIMLMHLKSRNRQLRDAVLCALPCLHCQISRKNVLSLVPLLADRDEDVRMAAGEALDDLMYSIHCVTIAEVVFEIIPLLSNPDEYIRQGIACFLSSIGQDNMLDQLSANQN